MHNPRNDDQGESDDHAFEGKMEYRNDDQGKFNSNIALLSFHSK
ncbi:hypothetical protein ACQEXU_09240 [Vibrio sp. TRT 21S02]